MLTLLCGDCLQWISRLHNELSFDRLLANLRDVDVGLAIIAVSCMLSTYSLAFIIFSALADAEVTYHRRFLYGGPWRD